LDELQRIAEHRSYRKFAVKPVEPEVLRLLFACALSAPSKSDLQQADIVHVFCGDNRRIRQMGEWRSVPFVNDHLDHFMNAAVDAGIVMTTFIRAAEAVGLGTCPISAVRNKPREMSELLSLPEWVFPMAGLVVGYPGETRSISPRLPLEVT